MRRRGNCQPGALSLQQQPVHVVIHPAGKVLPSQRTVEEGAMDEVVTQSGRRLYQACESFWVIIDTSIGHRHSFTVAFHHRNTTANLFDSVQSIVSTWLGG